MDLLSASLLRLGLHCSQRIHFDPFLYALGRGPGRKAVFVTVLLSRVVQGDNSNLERGVFQSLSLRSVRLLAESLPGDLATTVVSPPEPRPLPDCETPLNLRPVCAPMPCPAPGPEPGVPPI